MNIMVPMNLPLFKYTPHMNLLPAPYDYDTNVSRAVLSPRQKAIPPTFMHILPNPTPAILAGSSKCPTKI